MNVSVVSPDKCAIKSLYTDIQWKTDWKKVVSKEGRYQSRVVFTVMKLGMVVVNN